MWRIWLRWRGWRFGQLAAGTPHIGSRELSALRTLIRRWRELCECLLEIDRDRNLVIQRSGSLPRAGDHRVCGSAKWKSPETGDAVLLTAIHHHRKRPGRMAAGRRRAVDEELRVGRPFCIEDIVPVGT